MPQDAFDTLAGHPVFRHFAELVRTPRPSKGEAEVQDKLARWAESHGYTVTTMPGVGSETWGRLG